MKANVYSKGCLKLGFESSEPDAVCRNTTKKGGLVLIQRKGGERVALFSALIVSL